MGVTYDRGYYTKVFRESSPDSDRTETKTQPLPYGDNKTGYNEIT